MRDDFKLIIEGGAFADAIDRLIAWTEVNRPLLPDEDAAARLMIRSQIKEGDVSSDRELTDWLP